MWLYELVRRIEVNKMFQRVLILGALLCVFDTQATDLKIGYVQVDKILQEAPQTAESSKKLEKEFSPRTQELDKLSKQIKDMDSSLEKDSLTMSESERKNKERDVSNLKIDFQRKQRELREDVNLRKNEELGSLQDRINKAVSSVAEAESYDLVVYGGVAYSSKKIDITDKVLKALGKK